MPVSFEEKSQWLVLIALVVVYGGYFAHILPGHGANVGPGDMALFCVAVAALVALQVAGHIVLAIASRRELSRGVQRDERDTRIDLRAGRIASYLLATGVFVSLAVALMIPGNFAFVHVLFGSLVLSNICDAGARIALYRRGA
ncbi:hypothetical protein [Lysobacter claricitrinus]|uniref:hypothetical protein n=1 Tax=Lysobacter claricitrinus TaxID=3367728 RepID=UPI0037DBD32B